MWKRGRSIIAAAKEDWLLKFSQNIRLVLADDENRSPEHYAIHLDEDEVRSERNTIRLDRQIEDSTLAMACILDYAKIQGAPVICISGRTFVRRSMRRIRQVSPLRRHISSCRLSWLLTTFTSNRP